MKKANPLIIPRNYHVEEALKFAIESNDITKLSKLMDAIKKNNCDKTQHFPYINLRVRKVKSMLLIVVHK